MTTPPTKPAEHPLEHDAPSARSGLLPLVGAFAVYLLVTAGLHRWVGDASFVLAVFFAAFAGARAGLNAGILGAFAAVSSSAALVQLTVPGGAPLDRTLMLLAAALYAGASAGKIHELSRRLQLAREAHQRAQDDTRFVARHDPLTGLPNRLFLDETIGQELQRAKRSEESVGIFLVDLDRFQSVNDALGHKMGDELLVEAAVRLRAALRAYDTVARIGSDEFVVVVPELKGPEAAGVVAEKILTALDAPFKFMGQELQPSGSIGCALFPTDGENAEVLLKHADLALRRAKEQGRRRFALFAPALTERARHRMELERNLHHAIERGELFLVYQPQVDATNEQIVGMEALLRWKRPENGFIPPTEFIPIAEDTGLIVPIGEWVLKEACAQAASWHAEGYHGLRISVNLSAAQLHDASCVERMTSIVRHSGLDPHQLELEITESLVLQHDSRSHGQLAQLRGIGARLSVDDFGTGYSSLAYLTRLPLDGLKIDRSFVGQLAPGSGTEAVVRAIVAVARSLGLHIIAEGVETRAQLDALSSMGCVEMQGYYFAKPVPPEEASRLLRESRRQGRQPGSELAAPDASVSARELPKA